MKKCCSGLAVVLLSLVVFGVGHAQVDFHGVLNPNTHSVWVDTVILVVPPANETIAVVGWGSDSAAYDTFEFSDPLVWPLLVDLRVRVDTLHTQQVIPGPGNGQWYSFSLVPPPPPKVQFYGQTGVLESKAAIGRRLRLSVNPSVVTAQTTIKLQCGEPGPQVIEVLDAAGNLVRSLSCVAGANGFATATWHREDGLGRLVPAGVYFCRHAASGSVAVRKVLVAN